MKNFIKGFGGSLWASILGLSALLTIVLGFGLPSVVDTSSPWIVFLICVVVFTIAFFNGWKQRGLRNERDIERTDELERSRIELEKTKEVEIARINSEKELEIDRRNREDAKREKNERTFHEIEQSIAKSQRKSMARRARLSSLKKSMENLVPKQIELLGAAIENGGSYTTECSNTYAAFFESIGIFEQLNTSDLMDSHWRLTEDALTVLENNPTLKDSIIASSIKARDASKKWDFEHADYLQQLMMMSCYRNGTETIDRSFYARIFDSNLFESKRRLDGSYVLRLVDSIKDMIDRNPDVLGFCSPEGDVDEWLDDEIEEALRP